MLQKCMFIQKHTSFNEYLKISHHNVSKIAPEKLPKAGHVRNTECTV
jgi:hypothetical protein